jgi:hypothetical protein
MAPPRQARRRALSSVRDCVRIWPRSWAIWAFVAWLRAVRVNADGTLERLDEEAKVDPEEIVEGNAILLAQLLGLLVAFIGEKLTLRVVHEAWPELSLNDLELATGAKK